MINLFQTFLLVTLLFVNSFPSLTSYAYGQDTCPTPTEEYCDGLTDSSRQRACYAAICERVLQSNSEREECRESMAEKIYGAAPAEFLEKHGLSSSDDLDDKKDALLWYRLDISTLVLNLVWFYITDVYASYHGMGNCVSPSFNMIALGGMFTALGGAVDFMQNLFESLALDGYIKSELQKVNKQDSLKESLAQGKIFRYMAESERILWRNAIVKMSFNLAGLAFYTAGLISASWELYQSLGPQGIHTCVVIDQVVEKEKQQKEIKEGEAVEDLSKKLKCDPSIPSCMGKILKGGFGKPLAISALQIGAASAEQNNVQNDKDYIKDIDHTAFAQAMSPTADLLAVFAIFSLLKRSNPHAGQAFTSIRNFHGKNPDSSKAERLNSAFARFFLNPQGRIVLASASIALVSKIIHVQYTQMLKAEGRVALNELLELKVSEDLNHSCWATTPKRKKESFDFSNFILSLIWQGLDIPTAYASATKNSPQTDFPLVNFATPPICVGKKGELDLTCQCQKDHSCLNVKIPSEVKKSVKGSELLDRNLLFANNFFAGKKIEITQQSFKKQIKEALHLKNWSRDFISSFNEKMKAGGHGDKLPHQKDLQSFNQVLTKDIYELNKEHFTSYPKRIVQLKKLLREEVYPDVQTYLNDKEKGLIANIHSVVDGKKIKDHLPANYFASISSNTTPEDDAQVSPDLEPSKLEQVQTGLNDVKKAEDKQGFSYIFPTIHQSEDLKIFDIITNRYRQIFE